MKGLVIAAGSGTRLRAVSESKPLAPVAGVPLIERAIASAAAAGIRDFVVVTGHRAERVEAFLGTLPAKLGVSVGWVRVENWQQANGHSVIAGAGAVGGDFLLMMADHLFDPGIARRLLALATPAAVTLAVDRDVDGALIDLADATKVELAPDGAIVRIGKMLARFDAIDTGLFRATPALADAIRADIAAGGEGSLSAGVQRLAGQGRAATIEVDGARWIDVDDPRALALAEKMLADGAAVGVRGNAA